MSQLLNNPIGYGIVVFGAIIIVVILANIVRRWWQIAPPDMALIISGIGSGSKKDDRSFKIVTGAGTLVMPWLQQVSRLSLNVREAILNVDCVTQQGIAVSIEGVCIYKIANDLVSITNAATRFIGQENSMESNIQNIFEGHLRSIIGTLTVEDLIRDRTKLRDAVREAAKDEMAALGLQIDSLQIKDISDGTSGYIEALSRPHLATVKQLARTAEAVADQTATISEQDANAAKAKSTSESQIQQAQFAANTHTAQAKSEQQGPLAEAQAKQTVTQEQTRLAELEADRTEQVLQATVRKPADAEAYRLQTIAGGQRAATIAEAEGNAQRIRVEAQGEADAKIAVGDATGKATTATGLAEAAVIKAKLLSEADGIKAKAAALAENSEAVIGVKLAELMPSMVQAAAEPFKSIKEMVVLNGGDGLNKILGGTIATVTAFLPAIRLAIAALKSDPTKPTQVEGK